MIMMIFHFVNDIVTYMINMHMIMIIFHFLNAVVVTYMSNMHMIMMIFQCCCYLYD